MLTLLAILILNQFLNFVSPSMQETILNFPYLLWYRISFSSFLHQLCFEHLLCTRQSERNKKQSNIEKERTVHTSGRKQNMPPGLRERERLSMSWFFFFFWAVLSTINCTAEKSIPVFIYVANPIVVRRIYDWDKHRSEHNFRAAEDFGPSLGVSWNGIWPIYQAFPWYFSFPCVNKYLTWY